MAGWRTVVVNTHSKLSYKNNHLIFKDAYLWSS
ncbi:cytoplasmic protein [Streptococcus pyogenes]|nr:cytoplasmic protein [Streptococcus pyogenes]